MVIICDVEKFSVSVNYPVSKKKCVSYLCSDLHGQKLSELQQSVAKGFKVSLLPLWAVSPLFQQFYIQ